MLIQGLANELVVGNLVRQSVTQWGFVRARKRRSGRQTTGRARQIWEKEQ
jgi:hypothetical protein